METIQVVCPHCMKVNRLPKKDHYNKAVCGHCKRSLLENPPMEVDAQGFNHVLQKSDLPVVVDFWAPWCGPCRMMAPAFAQASESMPLQAQFLKVNTEANPQISAQYGIRSIPTMILFKNGREIDRVSGALSADQIVQWVRSHAL